MRVLITGGAGFIGSNLADKLLSEGHDVCVIDNLATGRRENIADSAAMTFIEGDIVDRAIVDNAFKSFKPEMVVHAAASYKDPEAWEQDTLTNVMGSINVVRASAEAGVKRIIYFQTSLCYGLEPLEQPITLKHPLFSGGYSGGSSYAISKTAGEMYIELSGIDFISFRLANAYGPRNLSGPLPTFYKRLSEGADCFVKETRRDFIYISDLIVIVMLALQGMGEKGVYHVSSASDYSIKELYDATVKAMGINSEKEVEVLPRSEDDVFTILIDCSKTNKDFNWKVTTPLETGVAKAIEWYRENGVTQTFTHLKINEDK